VKGLSLSIALTLLLTTSYTFAEEHKPTGYFPIPPGSDHPQTAANLNYLINEQNQPQYRQHGWSMFEAINRTVKVEKQHGLTQLPIWQTWFSEKQIFTRKHYTEPAYCQLGKHAPKQTTEASPTPTSPHLSKLKKGKHHTLTWAEKFKQQTPTYPNSSNPDGMLFANNGDIMIAGEYFNLSGFNHLRKHKLYLRDTLKKMLADGKKSIPTFPADTMVLKSMYWPIAKDSHTALPVWDNTLARPPYQYNGYETWKRAVAVQGNLKPISQGQTKTVKSLYKVTVPGYDTPRRFPKSKVVSIGDFYHIQVNKKLLKAMDKNDRQILNNSANWAYNRDFQAGDYIAQIALHINTKEVEAWTFQSFWWHDQPNVGPFASGRPNLPTGTWQNYLMAEAYSQVTPREYDGSNHVAYNPYIEPVIHPIPTNCQNCHARAALNGKYDDNPSGRREIKPNDPIFKNDLRTDYLWIIPDRAIPLPMQ